MMRKIILILMFVFSLLASENEEIGVPYIDYAAGQIDSAVLAPDGESFYTLKGDLITQWQLSPLKKLMSFKAGINSKNTKLGYNINVTSDNKMIIRSESGIALWDLKTKKLLKSIQVQSYWGLIDGSKYLTIDKKRNLIEWDGSTLKKITTTTLPDLCSYFDTRDEEHGCIGIPYFMFKSSDKFIFLSHNILAITERDSFEVSKTVSFIEFVFTSMDQKYLYFNDGDWSKNKNSRYQKLDINTGRNVFMPEKWLQENKFKFLQIRRGTHDLKTHSFFKSLSLISAILKPNPSSKKELGYLFFDNINNTYLAKLMQFENDALIMIDTDGNFEVSEDVKVLMKMKTLKGEIVPISDYIYKKYNRNLNLKVQL